MITKHHNADYDAGSPAGIPKAVGDRLYGQDLFRNFHYLMDRTGFSIGDITDQAKFIISGGKVTQPNTGLKEVAISACVAYITFSVQVPNSTGVPPTTTDEDIEYIRVECPALVNQDASGATFDSGTVNYVKMNYTDLDGLSRARAKKAGSYNFDQSASYTIVIDDVAPTAYDIVLTRFIGLAAGTVMYLDDTGKTDLLNTNHQEKENLAINGNFRLGQRGVSFTAATAPLNSDDTYLLDRWILLSDGNDIVDVTQETDVPNKGNSCKSLVATINKKWGYLQVIENKFCGHLQDKKVSLTFWAKTTTSKIIENIRASVISWDGAADTVTSDIVSAWNASGSDPTLVANWTYENTPVDLQLSTEWQKFIIDGIDIDTASTTNLGIFIWVDDTDGALNDELFLAEISLNEGELISPVRFRNYKEELALCQRYYYQLGDGGGDVVLDGSTEALDTAFGLYTTLPVEMRTTPTVVMSGTWNGYSAGTRAITNGTSGAVTKLSNYILSGWVIATGLGARTHMYCVGTNGKLTTDAEL